MADTPIEVPVGSLLASGENVYFINSGDSKLVFTGAAPGLVYATTLVYPTTGSLDFTMGSPTRPVGLLFEGYAPTVLPFEIVPVPVGSLGFTGETPERIVSAPPSKTITPFTGTLSFAGTESALNVATVEPGVGSLAITGYAPNSLVTGITAPVYPFFGIMSFTGYAPVINVAGGGTSITNPNATTDVESNYVICDYSGFKVLPGSLKMTWNKYGVRSRSWESRHPQDLIKGRPERRRKGSPRPEQDDRFIEDLYPDNVDSEDL